MPRLVYWDSCVFLYFFSQDRERYGEIRRVIERAKEGKLLIVTSVVTPTEVLFRYRNDGTTEDLVEQCERYLDHSFIATYNVDRAIAKKAAELCREHKLGSRDALHLATCMRANINELHTYDGSGKKPSSKLIPLSGQVACRDGTPIHISTPRIPPSPEKPEAKGEERGETLFPSNL